LKEKRRSAILKRKSIFTPQTPIIYIFFEKVLVSQVVQIFAQTLQGCFVFKTIWVGKGKSYFWGNWGGELYWGEIY